MITLKIDQRIWTSTISSSLKVTIEDPPVPDRTEILQEHFFKNTQENVQFGKSKD